MACFSGKAKIKGVTERASRMKKKKEKIDFLLEQNANEQLASVDWGKLNTAISQRLDNAERSKITIVHHRVLFKAAAGFAAAAVIVVVAILLRTEILKTVQPVSDGKATVSFIDNNGSTSVEIKQKEFANATVEIGGLKEKKNIARCDIEIINVNGDTEKRDDRATWIIIRVPEPVLVDNGISRDQTDLACLL
jgi:hypothetical protein